MKGEFYKMDFRAWNIGTVDLTLEQEAAYLRLCHAMYDVGGAVPNSTRMLMGLFRCGNTKATALLGALIAAGKIAVTSDDRLINHRVTEELASREKVSAARRVAGERGGSALRATAERLPSDARVDAERPSSDLEAISRKSLKNNDTDKAIAPTLRSRGEEKRGEKKEPQDPNGSSSPTGAGPIACRVPDGFEYSEVARRIAAEFGYVGAEIADVLGEFVDYWRPLPKTKAATKSDWPATLRNRLRELRRRNSTARPRSSPAAGRPRSAQDGFLSRAHEANRDLLAADHDLPMEDPDDPGPFPGDAGSIFGTGGCSNGHARPAPQQPFGGDRGLPPPRLAGPPRPH